MMYIDGSDGSEGANPPANSRQQPLLGAGLIGQVLPLLRTLVSQANHRPLPPSSDIPQETLVSARHL